MRPYSERPPIISVVIPYHNAVSTIADAILSLVISARYAKDQGLLDSWLQVICVDNASTDGTPDVVSRVWGVSNIGGFAQLCHESELRKGVAHARNRGLELSAGDYVAFLDADDRVEREYFALLLRLIAGNPDLIHLGLSDAKQQSELPVIEPLIPVDRFIKFYLHGWWCWSFVARRSLFLGLSFAGECYEDVGLFPFVLSRATWVSRVKCGVYRYQRSRGGLTSRAARWRSFQWDAQFGRLRENSWQITPVLWCRLESEYLLQRILLRASAGMLPVLGLYDSFLFLRSASTLRGMIAKVGVLLLRNSLAFIRMIKRGFGQVGLEAAFMQGPNDGLSS